MAPISNSPLLIVCCYSFIYVVVGIIIIWLKLLIGECDGANDGEGAETSGGSSSTPKTTMMLLSGYHCCFSRSYSHDFCLCFAFNFCLLVLAFDRLSCRALGETIFLVQRVRCDELRAVVPSHGGLRISMRLIGVCCWRTELTPLCSVVWCAYLIVIGALA